MILRAVVLLLALALPAAAQTLPEPLSDTVSDYAGALDATEEGRISRTLQQVRDETGVHMVVVTMDRLADYAAPGQRLESYAKALFNAWGVGDAKRNDGILMLVLVGDREVRIALGSGYDPVYDGRAARVLSTAVLPEFREGRMAGGIEAGIVSARERLIAPYQAGQPVGLTDGFAPEPDGNSPLPVLGGIGAILSLAGYGIWRGIRARRTCPKCRQQTLERTSETLDAPGMLTAGMGLEHVNCTSCGHTERRTYTIPPTSRRIGRSGSGGGGSSGFGGGRSSGGGASGKW